MEAVGILGLSLKANLEDNIHIIQLLAYTGAGACLEGGEFWGSLAANLAINSARESEFNANPSVSSSSRPNVDIVVPDFSETRPTFN